MLYLPSHSLNYGSTISTLSDEPWGKEDVRGAGAGPGILRLHQEEKCQTVKVNFKENFKFTIRNYQRVDGGQFIQGRP